MTRKKITTGSGLKINSKEARKKVKSYLVNNFKDLDSYREGMSEQEILQAIAKSAAAQMSPIRRGETVQEAFENFCCGLPDVINCDFIAHAQEIDFLGDLLEQSKEYREQFDNGEACRLACYMFFKELKNYLFKYAY